MLHDRRFELRHGASEPVELRWTDADKPEACSGFLRDFSRSGLRVELNRAIRVGTNVQFDVLDQHITATVRSCTKETAGFIVGLELDAGCEGRLKALRRRAEIPPTKV